MYQDKCKEKFVILQSMGIIATYKVESVICRGHFNPSPSLLTVNYKFFPTLVCLLFLQQL